MQIQRIDIVSISTEISKLFTATLRQEFRSNNDGREAFVHSTDVGIARQMNNFLKLGINYRQEYVKVNGDWLKENRPHLNLIVKGKLNSFYLSNRNRLEYRFRERRDDIIRYRNQLRIGMPLKLPKTEMKHFSANEIFVDSDHGEYNQNRLSTGFSGPIIEGAMNFYLYYMLLSFEITSWEHVHVLGMSGTYKF